VEFVADGGDVAEARPNEHKSEADGPYSAGPRRSGRRSSVRSPNARRRLPSPSASPNGPGRPGARLHGGRRGTSLAPSQVRFGCAAFALGPGLAETPARSDYLSPSESRALNTAGRYDGRASASSTSTNRASQPIYASLRPPSPSAVASPWTKLPSSIHCREGRSAEALTPRACVLDRGSSSVGWRLQQRDFR